jgi:hypothetical protein
MKNIREQIEVFQKELNDIQRNYDRAKGRYQSYIEGLKKSFEVKTLAEAKILLKEKKEELEKNEKKLSKAVDDFEREYLYEA